MDFLQFFCRVLNRLFFFFFFLRPLKVYFQVFSGLDIFEKCIVEPAKKWSTIKRGKTIFCFVLNSYRKEFAMYHSAAVLLYGHCNVFGFTVSMLFTEIL
jgi:hypothetical protein